MAGEGEGGGYNTGGYNTGGYDTGGQDTGCGKGEGGKDAACGNAWCREGEGWRDAACGDPGRQGQGQGVINRQKEPWESGVCGYFAGHTSGKPSPDAADLLRVWHLAETARFVSMYDFMMADTPPLVRTHR